MGLGAMQLRRLVSEPKKAAAILERAIGLGVDHIDTAQFYADGFVNETIAGVLRSHPDVLVATKVGADPVPGGQPSLRLAQRPEQLRASVVDNLRALGVDRLPLVYLRRADLGPGLVAAGDQVVNLDDQLAALIELRDRGMIGAIGLSAVGLDTLKRARHAGIAGVQNAYSLLNRDSEPLLEYCLSHDLAWVPFFPLGGGLPGLPKVTDQPKVLQVAASLGVTPSQVGLAWLLTRSANVLLIPGTADLRHLAENVAAADVQLSPETIAELAA
jgi:pyridoxine 4-dehydrogenase